VLLGILLKKANLTNIIAGSEVKKIALKNLQIYEQI
jgi:hypothetical protein